MEIQFESDQSRQAYAAGFQHAMEYACDAWQLLQHRGKGTVTTRRLALRQFARNHLAKPVAGDSLRLSIPHLEEYEIGFDKRGVFYCKSTQQGGNNGLS